MGGYDVIVKTFDIENYGWGVHIYIGMNTYYIDQIVSDLRVVGCPNQLILEIKDKMIENKLNTGFTYSKGHSSIIVTAPTTNPKQTINSLTHEIRHLVDDIAKTEKLDPYGEDVAYLTGETMMQLVDELRMILSK